MQNAFDKFQVFFVRVGHPGYPQCLDLAGGFDEDVCGINFGDYENDVPILYLHPHDGFHSRPLQHYQTQPEAKEALGTKYINLNQGDSS